MNDVFEGDFGWGHVHNGFAKSRQLSQQSDFDMGSRMAQIFSGCMFSALAVYMVFSNSTRLKVVQKQSFEKRLATCCQINTIVAAISAFLNFFQLTEVDNWALPGNTSYSVDVARPIEWILTCPLLQLSLVLMGGSKIPEYRRTAMPGFAYSLLLLGALTLFIEAPFNYIVYMFSCCIFCVMCFFNRQQILEASDGTEGLFQGDSEYRKCTIVLLLTWLPFPAWFMLTPEGLGLIEDVVVIQMGWACLNITAKFTMIFFIQRVKDNYWNRVKLTKELKLQAMLPDGQKIGDINVMDEDDDGLERAVGEQMVFGGTFQQHQEKHAPTNSSRENTPQKQQPFDISVPMKDPNDGRRSPSLSTVDLEPLESRLEHLETKLFDKFEEKFERLMKVQLEVQQNMALKVQLDTPKEELRLDLTAQIDKSQESIREKLGCGLQDLGKAMEKMCSMLEAKMEISFAHQNKENQSVLSEIRTQLQEWPELLFQRVSETYNNNSAAINSLQASMDSVDQKMGSLEDSQQTVMSTLSGNLTSMTDGWANQIIQENKAAAFTIQTKIGVMEEMQNKRSNGEMDKIASKLQQYVNEGMEKMHGVVVNQTLASTEKLHASIEASKAVSASENHQLQTHLSQLIKEMNADCSKHVEAGIGVFGNSLRAQLENLQSQQLAQRMETEAGTNSKWDGLLARMQQQSTKQVDQLNEMVQEIVKDNMQKSSKEQAAELKMLHTYMEEIAKSQQDRHQDIYAIITSVLEQSCGAKTRAEESAMNVAKLHQQIVTDQQRMDHDDDGPRFSEQRNTTGSMRPSTAGNGRRSAGRGGSGSDAGVASPSFKQSKYGAQYGLNVLNS